MSVLKRWFAKDTDLPGENAPATQTKQIEPSQRIYAIGDIHGRHDLLVDLLNLIEADDSTRPPLPVTLVFLGDLIDRGLMSQDVVHHVMTLMEHCPNVRCLMGNHEELLMHAWAGEESAANIFLRAGGLETLVSYGASADAVRAASPAELCALTQKYVPKEHVTFLGSLENCWRSGDVLFVHAGIRPNVPIGEQKPRDMRWIRKEFTDCEEEFGVLVVHGHSITEQVDERTNRIGIDTGAFASGRLTAIGLEGGTHWFVQTGPPIREG